MTRTRVLVAGLGDAGLLTAIHLAKDPTLEIVGISSQPGLVSGQELGIRLARPEEWVRDYWLPFDRFRGLDGVRTVHGVLESLDPDRHVVLVSTADGEQHEEPYDHLVIATGVRNGFWRTPTLRDAAAVAASLREPHERLAQADRIAVIGGGAAAVATAANLAARWPAKRIDLHFPGDRALPQHHPRTWSTVEGRLRRLGVGLHPGHRAVVPESAEGAGGADVPEGADAITTGPVRFVAGGEAPANAVVWAIGRVRPNSGWLPADLLDDQGFVPTDRHLRVPGATNVWAIGDVAAPEGDPLRATARNRADTLLARNIAAAVHGRPLGSYRPAARRWGSVLGVQDDGLQVFTPGGRAFRFPAWTIRTVLQPLIVRRGIYGGVRGDGPTLG